MYEEATVLDYAGKKIWIKHVNEQLYCVNGRYIVFNPRQDISNSDVIAAALDEWYSPLNPDLMDTSIISFFSLSGDTEHFGIGTGRLANCMFDTSMSGDIMQMYKDWSDGRSDIYINDCRDMDVGEWLERQKVEVTRDES